MRDFLKIIRYILPYKLYAVLNVFFNILAAVFSLFSFGLAIPFLGILFKNQALVTEAVELNIFDFNSLEHNFNYWISGIIIENGEIHALIMIGVLVIVSTFFKTAFMYLANHFMVPIRNGSVKDIRNMLFNKTINLPLSYYSEEKKGNVIARMSNDVQEIEWAIMSSLEMIFRDPIKIILYLGTLLLISWQLTAFVFILLPIVGLIVGHIGKSLRKTSRAGQNQMGSLLSQIEEMLGGLRIIKAFNAEKHVENRFHNTNNEYTRLMNKINRKRFLAGPLSEFLATIAMVAIMWYGGNLVLGGESTMQSQVLIGYLIIFSQIISPAKNLSSSWYNVKKGLASVDRINEIINAKNNITEKPDAKTIEGFNRNIEYQNINFCYSETPVLQNINFSINKGETIALVGQSGSGKSTLVDLLPRFYDISDGEIFIDNINIKDYKIKDLRNLIGYVSQNPILFNDSFYNNIAFGTENATEDEIIAAAKVANAHDFIMETPGLYNSNIGDSGSKLSGGQRQRLSIARAVLKNPPILILDEATSALDTESEKLVQDALEKLMKNRTSIVIAHRLSTVKNANKIIVVHDGKIAEEGVHDELLTNNGIYTKLYNLQIV
jgi:ATP-binding cassette, subfamily B, bacterial MsbA